MGAVVRSLFKVSEMFCIRIEDVEWGSTRYVESENFKYKHIRNKHLQISNMSPSQSWDKPCALFW